MRRATILCLFLLAAVALAQSKHSGSSSSSSGITLASGIGSSPAAAGATLSAGTLTLQPADATHPGLVTTGTQTIAGAKTLSGGITLGASGITFNDATTQTTAPTAPSVAAFGSSPTANGATVSGSAITLQPADAAHPGSLSTAQQAIGGQKDFQTHISVASGSNIIIDGSAGTHTLSWNSGSAQAVLTTNLGAQGFSNGTATPATQGLQFSGNNTFLNSSGASSTVTLRNSGGTTYALFDQNDKGTVTLSSGTGTHTVSSGCTAVCTDTTANASVKCSVSTTTLTVTGTGTDVIAYLCF